MLTKLVIAILAGIATAATIIIALAWRTPVQANSTAPGATGHVSIKKPSAFGDPVAGKITPDVKFTSQQIAKTAIGALVNVIGYDANDKPLHESAGYVYSSGGIIVTSYRAVRGASSVVVETPAGNELNVIALMGYNKASDLAVLAVLEGNLPALENGPDEIVSEGDPVFTISPQHTMLEAVAGQRRATSGVDLIQLSVPAQPGSPVLNQHGKVIGVATGSLAVPTHYVSDLLAQHRTLSFAQMLEETQGR